MIEVEPVHLGAQEVVVHLSCHGPCCRVDRRKLLPVFREGVVLRRHRRLPVVGHAVDDPRLLERAPIGEEGDQVVVARALRRHRRRTCACTGREHERNRTSHGASHDLFSLKT